MWPSFNSLISRNVLVAQRSHALQDWAKCPSWVLQVDGAEEVGLGLGVRLRLRCDRRIRRARLGDKG